MRVFIVEDSTPVRERMVRALAKLAGVRVIGWASDAETATNGILQTHPDVVLLDIRLNHSTGLTVLDQVRPVIPALIIAVMTNYPLPQYRQKYLDHGADYFFDKSTEFDLAIETLRHLA